MHLNRGPEHEFEDEVCLECMSKIPDFSQITFNTYDILGWDFFVLWLVFLPSLISAGCTGEIKVDSNKCVSSLDFGS